MKRKELAIVVGAVLGLSIGAPSLVLGQEQGMSDSTTDQQQMRTEDAAKDQGMAEQQTSGDIMDMTVSELKGKTIYNAKGDKLGQVDNVVTDRDQQLNVVLSIGGFLGIGEKKAAVPVSQLIRTDDRIATDSAISAEDLADSAVYEKSAYNEVSGDVRLSEAAQQAEQKAQPPVAGEPGTATKELAGFENLDSDGNGFISQQEADTSDPLINNWQVVDIDSDGQLNQAEFSAFEAGYKAKLKGQGMMKDGQQPKQEQQTGLQESQAGDSQELASFSELDENKDGYISEQEAAGHDALSTNWEQVDGNSDGHLDQAEFSAFETMFQTDQPMQGQPSPDTEMMREQNN